MLVEKGSRQIAEKDIKVFKIVIPNKDWKHWDGPFHDAKQPFNEISEVDSPPEEDMDVTENEGFECLVCWKGFFHAYVYHSDAKINLQWLRLRHPDRNYRLLYAVIPKGATYYLSIGNNYRCAASNKLIVYKPKPIQNPCAY